MKSFGSVAVIIFLSLMRVFDGAHADEGDAFNFHVGQGFRYESNLYRLDDGVRAPKNKRNDRVSETTAGVKFDRLYSRQRIQAELDVLSEQFANHSNLDHVSPNARAAWEWELGNRWSGTLSHLHHESLLDFDEVGGTKRNLNTYTRSSATADLWWHPRWAVGAGLARARNRFDKDALSTAEFDTRTVDANLTYRPPTGNRAVLTLRDTDGLYPNRPAIKGSLRDYRQQEVRLGAEWQLTGATRVSGFIGRTRVEYRLAPDRDFSGTIGRVGVLWNATAKTSVAASVRREVGAQQDRANNFAVTEAISLTPRWRASDKMSFGAGLEWRRRDFRGDPDVIETGSTRARAPDRAVRLRLLAEYKPIRALTVAANVHRQMRDGSRSSVGYSANTADVSLTFEF